MERACLTPALMSYAAADPYATTKLLVERRRCGVQAIPGFMVLAPSKPWDRRAYSAANALQDGWTVVKSLDPSRPICAASALLQDMLEGFEGLDSARKRALEQAAASVTEDLNGLMQLPSLGFQGALQCITQLLLSALFSATRREVILVCAEPETGTLVAWAGLPIAPRELVEQVETIVDHRLRPMGGLSFAAADAEVRPVEVLCRVSGTRNVLHLELLRQPDGLMGSPRLSHRCQRRCDLPPECVFGMDGGRITSGRGRAAETIQSLWRGRQVRTLVWSTRRRCECECARANGEWCDNILPVGTDHRTALCRPGQRLQNGTCNCPCRMCHPELHGDGIWRDLRGDAGDESMPDARSLGAERFLASARDPVHPTPGHPTPSAQLASLDAPARDTLDLCPATRTSTDADVAIRPPQRLQSQQIARVVTLDSADDHVVHCMWKVLAANMGRLSVGDDVSCTVFATELTPLPPGPRSVGEVCASLPAATFVLLLQYVGGGCRCHGLLFNHPGDRRAADGFLGYVNSHGPLAVPPPGDYLVAVGVECHPWSTTRVAAHAAAFVCVRDDDNDAAHESRARCKMRNLEEMRSLLRELRCTSVTLAAASVPPEWRIAGRSTTPRVAARESARLPYPAWPRVVGTTTTTVAIRPGLVVEEHKWVPTGDNVGVGLTLLSTWYNRDELEEKRAPVILTVAVPDNRPPKAWHLTDGSPWLGPSERATLAARNFRPGETVVENMTGKSLGVHTSDQSTSFRDALQRHMPTYNSRRYAVVRRLGRRKVELLDSSFDREGGGKNTNDARGLGAAGARNNCVLECNKDGTIDVKVIGSSPFSVAVPAKRPGDKGWKSECLKDYGPLYWEFFDGEPGKVPRECVPECQASGVADVPGRKRAHCATGAAEDGNPKRARRARRSGAGRGTNRVTANDPEPLHSTRESVSLEMLPEDVWLRLCQLVEHRRDKASLCLAQPRLGLTAIRALASYSGPLMAVAIALWQRCVSDLIDEQLLRRYVASDEATTEGCVWLAAEVEAADKPELPVVVEADGRWYMQTGDQRGAMLRHSVRGLAEYHYRGELPGTERCVRIVQANGIVQFLAGGQGFEYKVGVKRRSGLMLDFVGARAGEERKVRGTHPSGLVQHFEGPKDEERKVRASHPSGLVQHFEGAKGEERVVRSVNTSTGLVVHFQGRKGAEYRVRAEWPDGRVRRFT